MFTEAFCHVIRNMFLNKQFFLSSHGILFIEFVKMLTSQRIKQFENILFVYIWHLNFKQNCQPTRFEMTQKAG